MARSNGGPGVAGAGAIPRFPAKAVGRCGVPWRFQILIGLVLMLLVAAAPRQACAYAVLSHEEVVDLVWKSQITPLLLARFPDTSEDQLVEAHAYAYGGCIIQDLGYYPFGSHFFSDLLHYVRTGDFVTALIRDSSSVDEYAFALGALAHYTADSYGHPAINLATGQEYPKLRSRFGRIVTYDDSPTAHLQTEFGFDVVEVAQNRYASQQFHNFIGFKVAKPVLERAFEDTYGFELKQVLPDEDLAIGTYRRTISTLIPKMTRVAVAEYSKQIEKAEPTFDKRKFLYRVSSADYRQNWGNSYEKPSVGARIVAFFIEILPKIGPLRALKLRLPDDADQQVFLKSMNESVDHYRAYAAQVQEDGAGGALRLPDRNLDLGQPTEPGVYRLADETYAKLLDRLAGNPQTSIPDELRNAILNYYRPATKNYLSAKPAKWRKVKADLARLESSGKEQAGAARVPPTSIPP